MLKAPIKWNDTFKNVIKETYGAKWDSEKDFGIIGLSKLTSRLALTGYHFCKDLT